MKRMWSKNELKNIADVQAKAVKKDIATLVDKDGHQRFIEGDITFKEITGLSFTFGKWSLSGSHLLIVIAGNVENGASISAQAFSDIVVPEWIFNKIIPIVDKRVTPLTYNMYSDGLTLSTITGWLNKESNKLQTTISAFVADADNSFRLQIDLLIDND